MNKPATSETSLDLTVRFVGGPPIDEVVYWIRRCAERQLATGSLTVVLEAKTGGKARVHEVRLERPDRILVTERDPNIMLAVRNAFERLRLVNESALHERPHEEVREELTVPVDVRRTRVAR